MNQTIIHVGLDVDDTQYHGSALNKNTGEIIDFKCRPTLKGLLDQLTTLGKHFSDDPRVTRGPGVLPESTRSVGGDETSRQPIWRHYCGTSAKCESQVTADAGRLGPPKAYLSPIFRSRGR